MERCFFRDLNGECGAIAGKFCDGYNNKCHFYKTELQFYIDRNTAVITNRKKGNCVKCKYREVPCEIILLKPLK